MATIRDVAVRAGVSTTTVSRYLNKLIKIRPETEARIVEAIEHLKFRPNILAKRLSTGRSESIGLVMPEIRESFFAELASAAEDEADRHGYTVFITSTRSDRKREIAAINRLQDRHVDGLIVMTNVPDDGMMAEQISRLPNVVLVDEDIPGVAVPRVFVENERGAYDGTRYLIEQGHRDIAYIGGPVGLFSAEERRAGFYRAMQEAGVPVRDELVRLGSYNEEFAQQAVAEFVREQRPPTAIFASSDYLSIGVIKGLRAAGISVPDQMSMVAFDGVSPLSELLLPPLTAVRQPIEQLGRRGFLALLALLNNEQPDPITRLPVELIIRGSVAAPARRS